MGLGGYLTWTALAREVFERNSGTKVIPLEAHGRLIKIIKSPAFKNNPHIVQSIEAGDQLALPIVLNNPATNYCLKDTPEKAFHKSDRHIIETVCEGYGIDNPTIQCEIFLSQEELDLADNILLQNGIGEDFIVIEPFSNDNYTPNRKYPFEKWQYVVDKLSKRYRQTVVQVGTPGSPILKNVTSLVGKTDFRSVAAVIKKAKMLLASEGGLAHVASAVKTNAVIVVTGYQSLEMVRYPALNYIVISKHGPCGLKIECQDCKKDAESHPPRQISALVRDLLKSEDG